MKRKGTAENKLKPGVSKNLDVATFGDIAGDEYRRFRDLVQRWVKSPQLLKLMEAKPFPEDVVKYKKAFESLRADTVELVSEAILKNRPEDLRKLAQVLESLTLGVKSPDVREVLIYIWSKQRTRPDYKFTHKELKQVVAIAKGIPPLDVEINEGLDKRVRDIMKAVAPWLVK